MMLLVNSVWTVSKHVICLPCYKQLPGSHFLHATYVYMYMYVHVSHAAASREASLRPAQGLCQPYQLVSNNNMEEVTGGGLRIISQTKLGHSLILPGCSYPSVAHLSAINVPASVMYMYM